MRSIDAFCFYEHFVIQHFVERIIDVCVLVGMNDHFETVEKRTSDFGSMRFPDCRVFVREYRLPIGITI